MTTLKKKRSVAKIPQAIQEISRWGSAAQLAYRFDRDESYAVSLAGRAAESFDLTLHSFASAIHKSCRFPRIALRSGSVTIRAARAHSAAISQAFTQATVCLLVLANLNGRRRDLVP